METWFYLIVVLSLININFTKDCPKERCQSNGQCVDNISLCPIAMSCPNEFTKMNQFTCSKDNKNIVNPSCPANMETCWDNSCVNDQADCPSMPTCPSTNTVRCHDNSCVKSIDDCPKYVTCPSFIPIRCPNGDCRRNLRDCPGLSQCPSEFSILCNDGSCRMTSDECDVPATQTQCNDQTMTRCPEGTCTSSKFLCTTPKTCPLGTVLCWNGSCAKNYKSCEKPTLGQSNSCSNPTYVRCILDGSCKPDINFCPTSSICPVDKPVRCWDFSCKEKIEKCPTYQDCPEGTTKCHDGTCTSQNCGTHITCSMDAPFKCYDNTCRRNPKDCPSPPDCTSKTPILCWDGKCVANRFDCLPPDSCPITEPVKCPDNMCRKTADECKVIADCPTGFIRCVDGTCRRKSADCINPLCPINFPHQCQNGQCVINPEHCEKENGCPFYSPLKCKDGKCVESAEECIVRKEYCIGIDTQLCPDGSCLPDTQICPMENGCPPDAPFKCANGFCIDNSKAKCPVPVCPAETPIKCLYGVCVVSLSSCPSNYDNSSSSEECPEGLTACADGKCAANPEECRPIFSCPIGYERCDDGSCRTAKEFCPIANTCPTTRKFRCLDGSCADSQETCLNISGCPLASPTKCSNSGLCVVEQYKCNQFDDLFTKSNGCDKTSPVKCLSGKCVTDLNHCSEKNDCPSDKVYCPNTGTCADKLRDCIKLGDKCPDGYVRCSKDGKCKPTYLDCLNASSCPVSAPFRCVAGACKKYPHLLNKSENLDQIKNSCPIGIQCPDYKPYLCADGSCAEKSSFCLSLIECPIDSPVRCFDRTCSVSKEVCDIKIKCPSKNPILCANSGNCVNNIFDCVDDTCPATAPYKCGNGKCEKTPRNCVINELAKATVCDKGEATCYDGTCRPSLDQCPIFPGCTDFNSPYKCPDGSCAAKAEDCSQIAEKPPCYEGENLCEDGVCRKECPEFGGCPNNKPLLCPTGICVNTISECAGQANCPLDTPIRCIDGSCVSNLNQCKRAKRDFSGTDVQIFVSNSKQIDVALVIGESNDIIGAIKIPSNTFYKYDIVTVNNTSNNNSTNSTNSTDPNSTMITLTQASEVTLFARSVPSSRIRSSKSFYNETKQDEIMKVFPYADASNDFHLEYEYSVLSSVVEIQIKEANIKINNLVLLMLAYDFPNKHESILDNQPRGNETQDVLDATTDVCLGKLNLQTNIWECTKIATSIVAGVNFELYGGINETGIYAVILNPFPDDKAIDFVPDFLAKYLVIILVVAASVAFVLLVGLYIFIRIYRYRGKYKESREESKKYEQKMQEMQMIGTTHLGQTLGDNLDNIIYTNNPSFRIVKLEGKNQRMEELQNLQESFMKRYRVLEKNNEQLKYTYENLNKEYQRLLEYKKQVPSEGNIVQSEEDL